jgi:dipeptidyl aminopeptidase/acylaminoacyl peptidase
LIDPAGHVLTHYPAATAVCCYGRALSPDGRSMLDLGEGMLQVGPAAGPTRTIWSTPNGVISAAAWSPNGRLIAFALTDESTPVPTSSLDVISVQAAQPEVVAKGTNIHAIAWSPDGTRIAFLQNQGDIRLVPAGGGTVTSLRTPPTMLPNTLAWAPGPQLLFDETGRSPTGVWTVAADGSGLRVVLAGATSPSWAPGGNYFAAVRGGRVVIADGAGRVVRDVGPTHARRVQWGGSG